MTAVLNGESGRTGSPGGGAGDHKTAAAAIVDSLISASPSALNALVAPNGQYSIEYLSQLLKDKKQLAAFPNIFLHIERLIDEGKLA